MEERPDKVSVRCACGDTHQFARQHAGRVARCPKLNRRFRVPDTDGTAVFIEEARTPGSSNEPTTPDGKPDSASVGVGGWLVKRATDIYQSRKQKRELYRSTHCDCPHCKAENLTTDFMCSKCGCPLQDDRAAFLFMEKRRQEAHELQVAQAAKAGQLAPVQHQGQAPPPAARAPQIQQKVVVRHGGGCLSVIGGLVVIGLVLVMIPVCAGLFSSGSRPSATEPARTTKAPAAQATPEAASGEDAKKVQTEKQMRETLTVGYTSYCVWRAWYSDRLSQNQFLNKRANAKWLFLDVSVRNDDTKARMVPPFKLIDENGAEYEAAAEGMMIENAIGVLETLNPSVTKQGLVVFDVPQNHRYRLKVSGGYWSGEDAFIQIVPGSPP